MKTLSTCSSLLVLVLFSIVTSAQNETLTVEKSSGATVLASASGERVRFTGPPSIVQIRLEIYSSSGNKVFDKEVRGGNVLDWHLQDGQAEPLADNSYVCVVTVKSLSGRITQRIGSVTVEKNSATVQPIAVSQLTGQQAQAIGPLEDNASLTVLKQDDNQTTTVIAHNGEDGQIIRGRGALSFRIGDFFRGTDAEQMRLTPEGNVGIGITHPLVRLDVDGLVRSSQGIVFPDGSIQYSAASRTYGARSGLPDPTFQSLQSKSGKSSGGQEHIDVAGIGTQGHIAKWTDNSGTLGDSSIVETLSGGVNVATFGGQPATSSSNNHIVEMIATGTKSPLTLVGGSGDMEFWKDQAAGGLPTAAVSFGMAQPGVSSTNDMVFSAWNGSSWSERMRMTNGGKVGIGTTTPGYKLDVNGIGRFQGMEPGAASVAGVEIQYGNSGGTTQGAIFAYDRSTGSPTDLLLNHPGGNVGIGTTGPFAKLHAVAGGALIGVFGESSSNAGVHGFSNTGTGVSGFSNTNAGVSGTTAGTSFNVAGVYGEATGNLGTVVGVYGKATNDPLGRGVTGFGNAVGGYCQAGGKGVHGGSTDSGGFGGLFSNTAGGIVLKAEGNVVQDRASGGWVKAMALIDPFAPGGIQIARCYNSQATGAAVYTPPCGISIMHFDAGANTIDFGFNLTDRFISATAYYSGQIVVNLTNPFPQNSNQIAVLTGYSDQRFIADGHTDARFYIFVY